MVTMGGFEPPLDRFSTYCLCRSLGYMVAGPSGWTRTTTARVKSPACSVDTTEGLKLIRSALERMAGFEPAPPGLEGPQAAVTPHSLWFGLRVSNPFLRVGDAECSSTPRPNAGRCVSPPRSPFPSVVKEPALASWWAARDSNQWLPEERTGLRPVSGPSARTARLGDSARTRTRPHELWRLGCSRYTTLSFRFTSDLSCETEPPRDLARSLLASGPKQKGLLGGRPRRPVSR